MATTFTATVEVKCWKEHECCSCHTTYRYLFRRSKKGQGNSEAAAAAAANQAVVKALKNQVELTACPTCGIMQPDMIGGWRFSRHGYILLASGIFLAGFALMGGLDIPKNLLLWIGAAVAGLLFAAHFIVAGRRFNSDLDANREAAQQAIEEGTLQVVKKGRNETDDAPEKVAELRQMNPAWCFVLMVVAILAIPAAEVVRMQQGWPWNPDWQPGVAGPGDSTYTYFPQGITSIRNMWRANANVTAVNAGELGLARPQIAAETSTTGWGDTIGNVKSTEKSTTSRLWVRIQVPPVADPQGKTLRMNMNLDVTYPLLMGNDRFDNAREMRTHNGILVLAAPRAGMQFLMLWWLAGCGGVALIALSGMFLMLRGSSLCRRALPTRVFPFDNAEEPVDPEDLVPRTAVDVKSNDEESRLRRLDIDKLEAKRWRSRFLFYLFLILMPLSAGICWGLILLLGLSERTTLGTVLGITGCATPLIGLIGLILMWSDWARQQRLIDEKMREFDRPARRRREDDGEEDRGRRRYRDDED